MITTTIAIVENRMIYLEGISCMLKDNGCSIPISIYSLPLLHAALQLNTNYPDLFLFNLRMLEDGDRTFINSIRQQAVSTKIIGYYSDEADLQFASVLHLDGVFSLKESPENIMSMINTTTADRCRFDAMEINATTYCQLEIEE